MTFSASDIERRLANLFRVGTVEEVDHDAALARVRVGGNLTVSLPWLERRAGGDRTWWPVEAGEQVVILSPSGDMTQGVILGALYRASAPAPSSAPGVDRREYKDGAVIQYDRNTHTLTANIPGSVSVTASGNITASAGGDIQANAKGDISADAGRSITGNAGHTISLNAPEIILAAGLIQLAGPLVASGLNGESYNARFSGNITQINGSYENQGGDVIASGKSLTRHTHTTKDLGGETSTPN